MTAGRGRTRHRMSPTLPLSSDGRNGRRFSYSILLAACCLLVLATHVYVGFERIRLRVVSTPQTAREATLAVPLPDLTALVGSPAAVIVRLRGTEDPTQLDVALDDELLADVTLEPRRAIRVDASVRLRSGEDHRLTLKGDGAGWQLESLEIANIHGHSSGLVSFVVVPRQRPGGDPIPPWLLVPVFIGLLALRPRLDWPRRRVARGLHRLGLGVVLLVFAATLLSDLLTRYRVLLSLQAVVFCALVLYAEPIARGLRHPVWKQSRLLQRLRPVVPHLVVVAIFLCGVARFYRPDTGFTTLLMFGEHFQSRVVPALRDAPLAVQPGLGYDGQFYSQLALDPLVRDDETVDAMDTPGIRVRRILFPWIASVLGGGQPWRILQVYALLNVACWVVLAWLLLRWLPAGGIRPTLAWAACLLSHGMLASVRLAVPDGASVLLLALGIIAAERNRHWLAAGILGVSGLGRETNVLGGVILPQRARASAKGVVTLALQAGILVAPLLLWMTYLWSLELPSVVAPGNRALALPLAGYVEQWRLTLGELHTQGWSAFASTRASMLTLIALATQALVLVFCRERHGLWWRIGIAYLGLMLVLGSALWEGYFTSVTRLVLPMTFAFNILLPRVRWFWPLWVLGNANLFNALGLIGF